MEQTWLIILPIITLLLGFWIGYPTGAAHAGLYLKREQEEPTDHARDH
jgi:hypothetical protein